MNTFLKIEQIKIEQICFPNIIEHIFLYVFPKNQTKIDIIPSFFMPLNHENDSEIHCKNE